MKKLLERICAHVSAAWLWCRDLLSVFWLCRFAVLAGGIGVVALFFVPQASEVLRELAERREPTSEAFEFLAFYLAVVLWGGNAWYWSRVLTYLRLPDNAEPTPRQRAMRVIVPRVLGSIAVASVPLAIVSAARAYVTTSYPSAQRMWVIAGIGAAIAIACILFVVYRRDWFRPWFAPEAQEGKVDATELARPTWVALILLALLSLMLFVSFTLWPLTVPGWFGAMTILLLAVGSWIPFGTILVYVAGRYRLPPLLALLLLAAIVFEPWNDNHVVRTLEGAMTPAPGDDCAVALRPGTPTGPGPNYPLCGYAKRWLEARRGEIEATPDLYPVYLVAAAGGGIRAAYWTAGILTARQDLDPQFAHHVFAISGVSGGSLGAMVFAGLLDAKRQRPELACGGSLKGLPLASCATTLLSADFLAPALATMLYPDLVQRFLPFPVPMFDRATTLERSWEQTWSRVVGTDWMAGSFERIASPEPTSPLPLLLLNATSVEGGKRAIVSPLPVAPLEFPDAFDVRRTLGRPLRNSTAAHLSARFTYASPAATIDQGGEHWGHLVDGGYFENSGAATAADVLSELQRAAWDMGFARRVMLVVIFLGNDPKGPQPSENPEATKLPPERWLVEALAPLTAMLRTRDGRGSQAQAVLKRSVEWPGSEGFSGRVDFYQPKDNGIPLPLGWMLSQSARWELDRQIIIQTVPHE